MSQDSAAPRYIHRRTDPHHGQSWSVAIRRRGKTYQRQFGDRQYGGCAQARTAAESYLRSLLAILPEQPRFRQRYVTTKSGVAGVSQIWERTRSGKVVPYYLARWPKPGKPGGVISRKFSIEKHGQKEAFELAVAARLEGVEKLSIQRPA